jgi:hypothetical protein
MGRAEGAPLQSEKPSTCGTLTALVRLAPHKVFQSSNRLPTYRSAKARADNGQAEPINGRTMRVFYGSQSSHAHRYFCRGDDSHVGGCLCTSVGGVGVDRAVAV